MLFIDEYCKVEIDKTEVLRGWKGGDSVEVIFLQ